MATTLRDSRFILEKETDTDVWKFEAILTPIICTANERGTSFIYDLESAPRTIDMGVNSQGAPLAPTTHQAFHQVQHPIATSASTQPAPKEFNAAPTIFAALMLSIALSHGWGAWQYYQGSISNQVECKQ